MRALLVVLLLVLTVACSDSGEPATIGFTKVDLPAGAVPVVLSADGDALLIGTRRPDQPVVPGLLRLGSDGTPAEVPVRGATPYGNLARWLSLTSDGTRTLAVGGERGGAHANVRWSVWTGGRTGLTEKQQSFWTFGGPTANDLLDAVLTPTGPHIVGMWASDKAGVDVAVWNARGDLWERQPSADTPLESTLDTLALPVGATAAGEGILVAGSVLATEGNDRRQIPTVWRSASGNTNWTRSPLPDPGRLGAALAARCQARSCAVAGRVDGTLALWRLTNETWTRVPGVPAIGVGDRDRLTAPLDIDGHLTQVVPNAGRITIVRDGAVLPTSGPTGTVTAAVIAGDSLYLIAGPDENTQTLWRTTVSSIK